MEIQNLKRRNSEYELFKSQRKVSERVYLCSRLEMEGTSSSRMLCKKLPRNWRIENTLQWGRKLLEKTKMGTISYAAWSGITNSESLLLRSWLTEHLWHTYVPHQALIAPSSKKPSREVGMPRNTRDNMSISGNVFDCQHARRDPDELHNDSRILAISLAFLRQEGIENSGSEEPLQSTLLSCFSVRARRKRLDDK